MLLASFSNGAFDIECARRLWSSDVSLNCMTEGSDIDLLTYCETIIWEQFEKRSNEHCGGL